ncbi:MAG: GNAT family N-acetyltransferase [Bacteroidota bacterium]
MVLEMIPPDERTKTKQLLNAYLLEMGETAGPDGEVDYPYLDSYWQEPDRVALKALYDGEWMGLVLINRFVLGEPKAGKRSIAEFYVLPAFRRKGLGRQMAHRVFEQYGGAWEVRQDIGRKAAQQFWRRVIGEYTQGRFEEVELCTAEYRVVMQCFDV